MTEPRRLKRAVIKEEFVALTGDLVSAIFLNQLLYWTERVKDVDAYIVEEKARGKGADIDLMHGWIYKKAEELISETMVTISPSTARRRLEDLANLGIIECRTNPNNGWDKVLQYRVKLVELSSALYAKGFALEGYSLPEFHGGTPVNQGDARNRQIDAPKNHGDAPKNHGDAAIPENTTKSTSENTKEIDPDRPQQSVQAKAVEDSAKIKAYRDAQHRSLFPVKENRSAIDSANAPSKVSAGGPDKDGQWLRVQIQDAGFTTYGASFMKEAAEMEETFTVEQLIRALQDVKEAHAKKVTSGEKGIWNVLSYLRKVLLNPESDKKGATNANRKQLSIKPTGPIFTEESRLQQLTEPF